MAVQSHASARCERVVMKVVFRTDASIQIGTGHVMRCLTLADALADKGAHCIFICREHAGNLIEHIRSKGYAVYSLSIGHGADTDLAHSPLLGATQAKDADFCLPLLAEMKPDWVVVDHYALDARWENAMAEHCGHVMVIDDLADRKHVCALMLDQNWFADDTLDRYNELVPAECKLYLGPEYALLKPEYSALRAGTGSQSRTGHVKKILIFLGGSDPSNQTAKILRGLSVSSLLHLEVDVIVGRNHPNIDEVVHLTLRRGGGRVHHNLPTLANLMVDADLMIGAGGSTTWERMCLGLPSIVISVAANQTATNLSLMNAGYITFLGDMNKVTSEAVAEAVEQCISNPSMLRIQSQRGRQLVNGKGADVISKKIFEFKKVKNVA